MAVAVQPVGQARGQRKTALLRRQHERADIAAFLLHPRQLVDEFRGGHQRFFAQHSFASQQALADEITVLGVVAGAFNGYPNAYEGGWFPALIPTASLEGQHWGLNMALVPPLKDRLYGAVSFQLKYRFR